MRRVADSPLHGLWRDHGAAGAPVHSARRLSRGIYRAWDRAARRFDRWAACARNAGSRANPALRRRDARQHRGLPHLRRGAGIFDVARRAASAGQAGLRDRILRDARELLWFLPRRREDGRPVLSRLSFLLESGGLLPVLLAAVA